MRSSLRWSVRTSCSHEGIAMDGKTIETAAGVTSADTPAAGAPELSPEEAAFVITPRDAQASAQSGQDADGPDATGAPMEEVTDTADDQLLADIIAALKTVYDPEIPADIYELGLIYTVDVDNDRNVAISMTLTAPGCPVAGEMPRWVENAVNAVPGVANTTVTMTFDPPWDMSRMSDEARLALNMF